MTENKRFNIKPSAIVDDVTVIIDDEKKYSFPILDSTLNYMFCKALNELSEENQSLLRKNGAMEEEIECLSEENKQLQNTIARLQLINNKLRDKDYTNYKKKIQELQEENGRLRRCINAIYLISSRESIE